MTADKNMLVRYLKDGQGNRCGCVIAAKMETGDVVITGSLCRMKKDSFSRDFGLTIALGRAHAIATGRKVELPNINGMAEQLSLMERRAKRYFQDAKVFHTN